MQIRNIVNKITGMTLGILTIDSWRIAKTEQSRNNANSKLQEELDKLKKINLNEYIGDSVVNSKLEATTGRIQEPSTEISNLMCKSNTILDKLNKGGLDQTNALIGDLKRNLERNTDLLKNVSHDVKDIRDTFTKNDVSGFIQEYLDTYREFLSGLTVEQLACVSNSIGFFVVLSSVNALIIAYYGNLIINYFNLEARYSKLAKFIQIRSKISNKLIKFQIIYIYIVCLVMLAVNAYMLFL